MSDGFENTGLMRRAWFKPMVGAWFALLLGGALWLMPPHIHALVAQSTQLSALHPMFAAPVGSPGVAVMSLMVALFGFFLGIAVAGRVAAASAPRSFAPGFDLHDDSDWDETAGIEDSFEEPRRRRVFSAREDIGEEGIAISAPLEDPGEDDDYEAEYSLEDTPEGTPEGDFEAVYAEMDDDYAPQEDEVVSIEAPAIDVEEAEFEPVEEHDRVAEPEPALDSADEQTRVGEAPQQPEGPSGHGDAMGDMSLEDLLGRLEGALEQHKKMVSESEEAAREPAPQSIPLVREPEEPAAEALQDEMPQAAEDDPVIAFLRREASRRMPAAPGSDPAAEDSTDESPPQSQTEAQAALRSALDRLGQVNRRD